MSLTSALRSVQHHLDLSHDKGLIPELIDKGVGMGASYLLGVEHGKNPGKADNMIFGLPLTLGVGLLGSGFCVATETFLPSLRGFNHHVNTIANAGLYNYAFAKGVSKGFDGKSGTSLMGSSVVGELPPAPKGTFLSPDEVRHFAGRR
jgi:hypothetical protein